jgi:formate dehydrogenase assembly factor FdhD
MAIPESGAIWFSDLKDILEENKNNPHFDLTEAIHAAASIVLEKKVLLPMLFITLEI